MQPQSVAPALLDLLLTIMDPVELEQSLRGEIWGRSIVNALAPAGKTPPRVWFGELAELSVQHKVESHLLTLLLERREHQAARIAAVARLIQAAPHDGAPHGPMSAPRDRYALLLRQRVGELPDMFQVGGLMTIESVFVTLRLTGSAAAPNEGADAPPWRARYHPPRNIGDKTGRHVGPDQPEPLEAVLRRPHRLWALLGDPGAGKTTVLRYAALRLIEEPGERLPIFLTVAELEDGLEPALQRLFEPYGAHDLTQWVMGEALAGRAVLLIDGLDEANDLNVARRKLLGLAVQLGNGSTMVVASRPIGFKPISIDFVTLALCPLGPLEQRMLLSRWVNDPVRVSVALDRLSRTPRLRRLAENPLLLTLAGLVLRAGQDIPQRRADLYESAVDVLVNRKHAPEGMAGPRLAEPRLAMELLGWVALRLHGVEDESYPRTQLVATFEASPAQMARLKQRWPTVDAFLAEICARTGLLVPDTGRVEDARAFSFPHRTFREFLAAMALERDMGEWAAGLGPRPAPPPMITTLQEPAQARPPRPSLWAQAARLWRRLLGGAPPTTEATTSLASRTSVSSSPTHSPVEVAEPPRRAELARVLDEGKARPERWSEVLALTCGRLGPGGADALVRRVILDRNTSLALRVIADAEGLSAETVRGALRLERGWARAQLESRRRVIEEIPALVKDLAVAVGLLEQLARATTDGHDLYWVREVLRRIARGELQGSVLVGSVDDARRAAKGAADNVLSHLDRDRQRALIGRLAPLWSEIPMGSVVVGGDTVSDANPPHKVTIMVPFNILTVPVTWSMYLMFDPGHEAARETFGDRLPHNIQDEVPVYNVSWYAAQMFAEWVGGRLPLEPEWEYACRGGVPTAYWSGDTEADLARVGWTAGRYFELGNAQGCPKPVGQKPGNLWNLRDLHGNVWEWCLDAGVSYAPRAEGMEVNPAIRTYRIGRGQPFAADPIDPDAQRIVRGGSWLSGPEAARSASRERLTPSFTNNDVGFRVVVPWVPLG